MASFTPSSAPAAPGDTNMPVSEETENAVSFAPDVKTDEVKQASVRSMDEEQIVAMPEAAAPAMASTTVDVDKDSSCCARFNDAFAGFLFPRLTPIPGSAFIILSLFASVP